MSETLTKNYLKKFYNLSNYDLSGEIIKEEKELLEEGWLGRIAGLLGITVASFSSAISQKVDVQQLSNKVDSETLNKIEMAMKDPSVEQKLNQLGIPDNNIQRTINRLEKTKKVSGIKEKQVLNDEQLVNLLKQGWNLTGVQTDTIINTFQTITPESDIIQYTHTLSDNAFFASGGHALNNQEIQKLTNTIDSLQQQGNVLLNISIESSTDKQGLSINLQNKLEDLRYSKDNNGLSKIRNDQIKQILISKGIDDSLIGQVILSEQGTQIIDKNARYVKIRFNISYLPETPPPGPKIDTTYKQTYNLIYLYSKQKSPKSPKIKIPSCKIKIKLFNKKSICPAYQ